MRYHVLLPSVLLSVLLVAACGTGSASTEGASLLPTQPPPTVTTAPTTVGPTLTSPTTSAPTSSAPTARRSTTPSAAGELAAFAAAARRGDARLHTAAAAVNGSFHGDRIVVTEKTALTVRAAEPTAASLWNTLPAGMPARLRDAALLVGSDLVSRYDAMRWAGYAQTYRFDGPRPAKGSEYLHEGWEQLARLGNGHQAAVHFTGDLARLQSLAARTARFTPLKQSSAAALDVAVRIAAIEGLNGGCDSAGGFRYTKAFVVVRESARTGTVAGVGYTGTLVGGRWQVQLNAC